jgi:hypothetical protein
MIKLVVSDIDGTLLPEGTDEINPQIYEVIRELKKKGITFVAASGRQYVSMYHVFEPVADDIIFVAENGSVVMQGGKMVSCNQIQPELAKKLLLQMRSYPDSEIMLSVPEQLYLEVDGKIRLLIEGGYHGKTTVVPDLLPYCAHTNKITVHRDYGIDELGADLQARFGDQLNVAVAGKIWVDVMSRDSDKGHAVAHIQQMLGVMREETMAFGDNCNDIGMLQQADYSYAVENAHPQLKAAARYEVASCREDGVLRTMQELL